MTKLWEKAIIEFGIKTSIVLKFHQAMKLIIQGAFFTIFIHKDDFG